MARIFSARPRRAPTALAVLAGACTLACGRTEPLWWADIYASDSGTEDVGDGDGDGDGDPTATSTSTSTTGDGDGDPTTDTDPTDTDTETDTSMPTTESTTEEESTTTGCEDMQVGLTGDPASVVFLLDQGAHMSLNYSGQSRWEAIQQALLGMQAGVVWAWEDQRRLGMVSFTGSNGMCPIAEVIEPQLGNGGAIELAFGGLNPGDDNPVADAIELAVPLFAGGPGHLILLTGRNPDTCAQPDPQQGADEAIAAADAAFAAGVTTRVIEVGSINGNYAQALADAGLGQGGAPFWTPGDADTLTAELDAILASLASCELILEQALSGGGEQFCTLELDGMPAALDDPDGWSVAAPDRITLAGAACDSLGQGAVPSLVCSCEAFEP